MVCFFLILEEEFTLLCFWCVVLGGVGGLSHVWAGLWCHTGLHRFSFPLSLFVTLWASTGNVCDIILGSKIVFKSVFNSESDLHLSMYITVFHDIPNYMEIFYICCWFRSTVSIPRAFIWSALFSAIVKNFFGSDRASTIAETKEWLISQGNVTVKVNYWKLSS